MIAQHSPTATSTLFDPIRLGPYVLPHRIFMAPLTRGRAGPPMHAEPFHDRFIPSLVDTDPFHRHPVSAG